jgi:type I restriction enzyme S subunit
MNQTFLLWFLRGVEDDIASRGTGTTFDSISGDSLRKQPVCVPLLPEQAEIVRILEEQFSRQEAILTVADAADRKVAALRRSLLHAAFSGELTKLWRERNNG